MGGQVCASVGRQSQFIRMTTCSICIDEAEGDAICNDARCPICLAGLRDSHTTPCNHEFCADCLAEALRRSDTCPMCRRPRVHTCDACNNQCTLCLAGHIPGVVTPNFEGRMTYRQVLSLVFKITALTLYDVAAGGLCAKGFMPFEVFCATIKCWLVLNHLRYQRHQVVINNAASFVNV